MPAVKLIAACLFTAALLRSPGAAAQLPAGSNTDETKVPPYVLPDPLLEANGSRVTTASEWNRVQRPYLYHLFEENVYGKLPAATPIRAVVRDYSEQALNGKAIRKQVRIYLSATDTTIYTDVLLYLPLSSSNKRVPVFLAYNFMGNQTITKDPAVFISAKWAPPFRGVINNRATDSTRGRDTSWPIDTILAHGYGLATAYYGDLEPDNAAASVTGIRYTLENELHQQPAAWGALAAWAWGLSRIMDYLEKDNQVDARKVALLGHSRLGKATLWAGASDTRFAIVISNESGEGGAALSRRWYGETIKNLNDQFPYWFVAKYKTYSGHADLLPVDQHMLLALMAPRPLYVASAEDDRWSDPRGEFLSAFHAGPVYALLGKPGLSNDTLPPVEQPVGTSSIHYHIRRGKHGVTLYDWQQYLQFAGMQWKP